MSRTPRVSIILPVHNGAAYLRAAVDSVLAQSFSDFELVCVDDGSSDDSAAILDSYRAHPAVQIVTLSPNGGLPAALNAGFAVARGDLHGWTSDDNILRPNMLATLVAALDDRPDIDIVHSGYSVIDAHGTVTDQVAVGPATDLLFGNNIGASFLYRRAVTDALGGYDEGLFGAEDYDFWLRAARTFRFLALPDDLYLYRKHGGSLTNRRAARIHALCTDIVLRELAREADPVRRGAIVRQLVLRDRFHARFDLIAKAYRLDPAGTVRATPVLLRWLAGVVRNRLGSA